MIAQLRSELRKMRTTRTNLGLLVGLVALILFGVIAGSVWQRGRPLPPPRTRESSIGNGGFAAAFAALIGVMAMTSELRYGTIRADVRLHALAGSASWSPQRHSPVILVGLGIRRSRGRARGRFRSRA